MAGITYQQALDQMNSALEALKRAKSAIVTSAHDRQLQLERVGELRKDFEYWEKKVDALSPEGGGGNIVIGQVIVR